MQVSARKGGRHSKFRGYNTQLLALVRRIGVTRGRLALGGLDENHLLTAVRYMGLNPVRVGLVRVAWAYP